MVREYRPSIRAYTSIRFHPARGVVRLRFKLECNRRRTSSGLGLCAMQQGHWWKTTPNGCVGKRVVLPLVRGL